MQEIGNGECVDGDDVPRVEEEEEEFKHEEEEEEFKHGHGA